MSIKFESGGGFLALLLVLFIGLKLGGTVTWSWVWVFSPFWVPFSLFLFLSLVVYLLGKYKI